MQRGISARQADALSVHCTDERGCKPPEFMHPIDAAGFFLKFLNENMLKTINIIISNVSKI